MIVSIPIYLAVEDELSEYVARRVLSERHTRYSIKGVFRRGGFGYLKKQATAFNNAARNTPFLLLTDLDQNICPSALVSSWLNTPKQNHFLLRVAVREVESWLLGDPHGLKLFLRLKKDPLISNPEQILDPKAEMLRMAISSPSRQIREALVWCDKNGRLYQGPDYNGTLGGFVFKQWAVSRSQKKCQSLDHFFNALQRLEADFTR
ncbi:MAG: DUF4276 family protein [Nitrospirae bacterium]|nr:MAG: DUF4276 family protein [Nitrospirota bacterium]